VRARLNPLSAALAAVLLTAVGCARAKAPSTVEPESRAPRPDASSAVASADASSPPADPSTPPTAPPPPATGPALLLVAGTLFGAGNVDGPATSARFDQPCDVENDGQGNLYIADSANHTIRRLSIAAGTVSTFAGAPGEPGSADGVGPRARFYLPCGLASDHAGNLYVSDTANHTIRRIDTASGAVSTLAGAPGKFGRDDGVGGAARFASPAGLALDRKKDLYVADSANNIIRKITLATGAVKTIAGSAPGSGIADDVGPRASFFSPKDVASDQKGNLYVTDQGNGTIRKIVLATGSVSTLAGMAREQRVVDGRGSTARFGGPHGLAIDKSGALYVADYTVRRIDPSTGDVTTIAGTPGSATSADGTGPAAGFDGHRGMTLDQNGRLYLAEANKARIRRVDVATGAVTTFAGPPATPKISEVRPLSAFAAPFGLVPDEKGNLFVADANANTIERVELATGKVETLAGTRFESGKKDGDGPAARFYVPFDLVYDGGNLYVADAGNGWIRKVAVATGKVTTFAGSTSGSNDGPGAKAKFDNPRGIARDWRGHLYVADSNNHAIRKIVIATGVVSTLAGHTFVSGDADGTGNMAYFNFPTGLAADESNLYVADSFSHTIRRVELKSGEVTTLAGTADQKGSADGVGKDARFDGPQGLAVDRAGNLFVTDSENHTLRKITLATGAVTTVVGSPKRKGVQLVALPASLGTPKRLAFLPGGELLLSDELAVLKARF